MQSVLFNYAALMLSVVFLLRCCCCEPDPERRRHQRLKQDLLYNYSNTVSPKGTASRVMVSVSFAVIAVIAVEEANQIFRLSGALTLSWTDPWLTWDRSNDIEKLEFEPEEIWTPKIVIANGVGSKISSLSASVPISVDHSGTAIMFMINEFETICNLDVVRYPYDEQVCRITVISLLNSSDFGLGNQEYTNIFSTYFTGSSEWDLVNKTISVKRVADRIPYVDLEFRLRRHSIFYTLSVIFPMCLLSFLNACVFLLPAASGEKVSFLVSIFVSEAVFLNYINDAIPKSGNASRLTIYLVLLLSQSALALLATLLVINTHHRQGALLCRLRKKIAVESTSPLERGDDIKNDEAADRLDKIMFVLFVLMAALSILVFRI